MPLRRGSQGEDVTALTQRLELVAYYYPEVEGYGVTQNFDIPVEDSVKSFQTRFGLSPTGVVDEDTWMRLGEVYFSLLAFAQKEG